MACHTREQHEQLDEALGRDAQSRRDRAAVVRSVGGDVKAVAR